jgi:hypothetical protein
MTDERIEEPTLWEARETQLVICPGLSWEEWEAKWQSLDLTQKNINWWLGDALKYAADAYGEKYTQVIDPKYAEQHRGILRVALRIPAPYRKASLSWSAHREAASAETIEERIEILDLAEKNDWGSREIAEEIRKRKDRQRPGWNMGPPLDDEAQSAAPPPPEPEPEPEAESRSTRNKGPRILPANTPPKEPAPQPVQPPQPVQVVIAPPAPQPPPQRAGPLSQDEIRAAIVAVRQIANPLVLQQVPEPDVQELETTVASIVRVPVSLRDSDQALLAIPPAWKVKLMEVGEHVFGGRMYELHLVKGKTQYALGTCPSLPCAIYDAAMSAMLSDMGAG